MNPKQLIVLNLVTVLVGLGCDDATKGKPKAEVTSATPLTTASAAPSGVTAETLPISNENSKLEFIGSKVTGKHDSKFNKFSGTVQLFGNAPEKAKIDINIDMESVETDNAKLTTHLKSADFFDVAKYPKATFTSTEITPGGAAGATHTIKGNLTLHGVTKGISFPATVRVADDEVTAKSEFAINRKDFQIMYPGKPDDLIKDEVLLKLDIRAQRKK
jgi:polyisoprenoid-binding protein YceI